MQRNVYDLFTLEHGIRMTPDALKYISGHVGGSDELRAFLGSFKSKFNTSEITVDQAEQILTKRQDEEELFIVHPTAYRPRQLSMQYDHFKRRIAATLSPISLLEEGMQSTIFGIFYRNRSGMPVLEDDHGVTVLGLAGCGSDLFLHENMFLALVGRKEGDVFMVESSILPSVRNAAGGGSVGTSPGGEGQHTPEHVQPAAPPNGYAPSARNNFLVDRPVKICVFGCYTDQQHLLDGVAERHRPDIAVVTLCTGNKVPYASSATKVVLCPCRCSGGLLPSRAGPSAGGTSTTNPFMLELHGKKIAFIDCNLFAYKGSGIFCNKQPLESFLRSIHSQQSYNPFAPCDLSLCSVPSIFVVLQDFYPFVIDVEGVRMVSVLPVRDGTCVLVDTSDGTVEVINI